MYCKKCGKELKATDRFCSGCGARIDVNDSFATMAAGIDEKTEPKKAATRKFHLDELSWDLAGYPTGSESASTASTNFNWSSVVDERDREIAGYKLQAEPPRMKAEPEPVKPKVTETKTYGPVHTDLDWNTGTTMRVERKDKAKFDDFLFELEDDKKSGSGYFQPDFMAGSENVHEPEKSSGNEWGSDLKEVISNAATTGVSPAQAPEPKEDIFVEKPAPIRTDAVSEDAVESSRRKIDKFYTFNKKNEEFQALLDQEYERLRERIREETKAEEELAAKQAKLEAMKAAEELEKQAAIEAEKLAAFEAERAALEAERAAFEAEKAALEAEKLAAAAAAEAAAVTIETIAEPEPEIVAEPAAEPEPEAVAEQTAEPEPEAVAETEPEIFAEPVAGTEAEPEPEIVIEPAEETKAGSEEPAAEPEPDKYAEPEPDSYAEPVTETESEFGAEPEILIEAEPEAEAPADNGEAAESEAIPEPELAFGTEKETKAEAEPVIEYEPEKETEPEHIVEAEPEIEFIDDEIVFEDEGDVLVRETPRSGAEAAAVPEIFAEPEIIVEDEPETLEDVLNELPDVQTAEPEVTAAEPEPAPVKAVQTVESEPEAKAVPAAAKNTVKAAEPEDEEEEEPRRKRKARKAKEVERNTFGDIFDEEDEDEDVDYDTGRKRGRAKLIFLDILILILAVCVVCAAILVFAEGTPLAQKLQSGIDKIVSLVTGEKTDNEGEDPGEQISYTSQAITNQSSRNANIDEIAEDTALNFSADHDYGFPDVLSYSIMEDRVFYEEGGRKVNYSDEVIGTIIEYYSKLIDRMNSNDQGVLDLIVQGSQLYGGVSAITADPAVQHDITKLQIGEVREKDQNFYVLVRAAQTATGVTDPTISTQVVHLTVDGSKVFINDIVDAK